MNWSAFGKAVGLVTMLSAVIFGISALCDWADSRWLGAGPALLLAIMFIGLVAAVYGSLKDEG